MTKSTEPTFRQQLIAEGVPAAYAALMRVLGDRTASATALASAARTMLDVAGLTKPSDADKAKEPHEMTSEELQAAIRRARADHHDDNDGVFD